MGLLTEDKSVKRLTLGKWGGRRYYPSLVRGSAMRKKSPGRRPLVGDRTADLRLLFFWRSYLGPAWASLFVLWFSVMPMRLAGQNPNIDISIIPKPVNYTLDEIVIRDARKNAPGAQKPVEMQDSCLLPPLNMVRNSTVAASALTIPSKAKKEYLASCAALKETKVERAEKHLRKAVEIYPQYSAAWVTLGQVFATQNHVDEARSACAQASTIEPKYLPAYLCLADLAAQEKAWTMVLQLSNQAIVVDATSSPLAYEYNAAANLRMNKLDEAEKSARRALEIDKNNSDPRAHFLLAQIYEAKRDPVNEIQQLKEYLKLAGDSKDAATVKQYLEQLEKSNDNPRDATARATQDSPAGRAVDQHATSATASAPTNASESSAVAEQPDLSAGGDNARGGCNLDEVLLEVQRRIREFVDNVQRFTATEKLVYESVNRAGQVAKTERGKYDYVVSIEESIAGMLAVNEYQNDHSASGAVHVGIVTKGLPALLLIFHPYYAGNYTMRCEGLTILKGNPTWQISFRQREDKPSQIRSYRIGMSGPVYEVNLQGRAWFTTDSYQIVKLESDLIKAIPEIELTVDHTSAEYGPVHFVSRGIEIWLPQTADLVSERRGKRLHERITFSDYLLFAIDNKQEIITPKPQEWLDGNELCRALRVCDWNRLLSSDEVARSLE